MKISLACDHGGLQLKTFVKDYLLQQGHDVVDCGTNSLDSCDYPDFARPAAQLVADGQCDCGIVICTTGIGVSIVANKVAGVRCALCTNVDQATMTRRHNNANMLAMGQKYVDNATAQRIVDAFLNT
ncbi:MAG: ribose 5-phosphate isomerase B [Clostridia bacterium]|nr:ribose 5-phosphate isomerase B [Clostridia bacterium]